MNIYYFRQHLKKKAYIPLISLLCILPEFHGVQLRSMAAWTECSHPIPDMSLLVSKASQILEPVKNIICLVLMEAAYELVRKSHTWKWSFKKNKNPVVSLRQHT